MRIIKVGVSFVIDVEVPDDMSDETASFMIEENGCAYTGLVGKALDQALASGLRTGTCPFCPSCSCTILEG